MAVSFYYCFSRGLPYDNDEVESPSMIFDYVLYFACLVLSATLGFIETRFVIFQGWTTHLLIASVVFGLLAYRFDNRFVLSLAISTMAGYLGLKLDLFDRVETDILRLIALAFGTALIALGVWLHRQAIKPHFLETYIHIGANVIMMATASGVLEPSTGWLYLAALLSLSAAAIYLGVRFDRFAFVAYGTLYGYAGVSARLLESIGGPTVALWYFLHHRHDDRHRPTVVLARRFATGRMSAYTDDQERAIRVMRLVQDWTKSGLLTQEQRDRIAPELKVDLRRTNKFLRVTIFVFGLLILQSFTGRAGRSPSGPLARGDRRGALRDRCRPELLRWPTCWSRRSTCIDLASKRPTAVASVGFAMARPRSLRSSPCKVRVSVAMHPCCRRLVSAPRRSRSSCVSATSMPRSSRWYSRRGAVRAGRFRHGPPAGVGRPSSPPCS